MAAKQLKVVSASIGAAAVVAMGALGLAFGATPDASQNISEPAEITLGETTTSTTGQTEIPTPAAVPEVTAEPAPTA